MPRPGREYAVSGDPLRNSAYWPDGPPDKLRQMGEMYRRLNPKLASNPQEAAWRRRALKRLARALSD